jgi:hypothetical protein
MELSPNQSALILEISDDGEISIDVASGDEVDPKSRTIVS